MTSPPAATAMAQENAAFSPGTEEPPRRRGRQRYVEKDGRCNGGETVETVSDFIFLGSKISADGDCSHASSKVRSSGCTLLEQP